MVCFKPKDERFVRQQHTEELHPGVFKWGCIGFFLQKRLLLPDASEISNTTTVKMYILRSKFILQVHFFPSVLCLFFLNYLVYITLLWTHNMHEDYATVV